MIDSNKPLVSVIIPNYNYARYLDERMDCILNQSYQNYEVIILDDHSNDDSLAVIDHYKSHPKVSKVIINETNSGSPFKQWERGINESSGEIIWMAESDDVCSTEFLETLVPQYVSNGAVMAFCHSKLIDEQGNELGKNHQMRTVDYDICLDGKQFIKDYLCFSNEVQNASCAIFSKSAALSIDKGFMNYKGAGDWLFWIEMAEKGKVCFVNQELNCYRLHRKSTSATNGIGLKEMYNIYQCLLRNSYLDEKAYQKCRSNNIMLISSLHNISNESKKELYELWKASSMEVFILRIISLKKIIKRLINQ
jgi:glycosyltransferase involved in cell wall biosynthesis